MRPIAPQHAFTNFDDAAHPLRFRFGFIASSDNHSARPGTGYKEYGRRMMTETAGARDATWRRRILGPDPTPRIPSTLAAKLTSISVRQYLACRRAVRLDSSSVSSDTGTFQYHSPFGSVASQLRA